MLMARRRRNELLGQRPEANVLFPAGIAAWQITLQPFLDGSLIKERYERGT
jgi:hypothetical protein